MRNSKKNQLGFSLTEVMVALGVSAIVTLGFTLFSDNLNQSTKLLNNRLTQEGTGSRISQVLGQPSSIASSISSTVIATYTENAKLRDCIVPGATPCDVNSPANQAPFTLVVGSMPISGGTNPVRYNFKGQRNCDSSATKNCQMAARTTFWATCGDPAATSCTGAQTIHFRYQVKQDYQFTSGADLKNPNRDTIPPNPPEPAFTNNKGDFSFALLAEEIRAVAISSTEQCSDPVAFMTGRTPDNKILCQCPAGYTQVVNAAAAGGVTCTGNASQCPAGQLPVGYDMATRTFKCAQRDVTCEATRRDCNSGGCACPAGAFIRDFQAGVCTATTYAAGKKGATTVTEIVCGVSTARCCKYQLSPP